MPIKLKLLIVVKTYPNPSASHKETVCTVGISEKGEFVRLYPISYRYLGGDRQFKKYQWVEVDVAKHNRDSRKESHRPYLDTLKILSDPLPTKNSWQARRLIVLKGVNLTMCQLMSLPMDERSLGVVRVREVIDFSHKFVGSEWEGKAKSARQHLWLDGELKDLERIPYEFRYKYLCSDPKCKGHQQMITDWEVGQLYRNSICNSETDNVALEKVKAKFLKQLCSSGNDVFFFVGTVFSQYRPWIILGVFYPPQDQQLSLI